LRYNVGVGTAIKWTHHYDIELKLYLYVVQSASVNSALSS